MEPDTDVDNPEPYLNSVWADEIETILSETAKTTMMLRHELENSDDTYRKRFSGKM